MNDYEQMRNRFLVEVENTNPHFTEEILNSIGDSLDRVAYHYDISHKETSLSVEVDPVPMLLKTYIVVKKTEGLSYGTLQNYARILKTFFVWVNKRPEEVSANDIRMFIYDYGRTHSVSDRTLDKYRETICWFFNWAFTEEYIGKNPARSIKAIKYESIERQALSQIELEYLRMACETRRDKAILEFLYSTGCRVSELTSVKQSDVNWHDGTVHLFGKGKKHRTSYINAKSEVALKEYLQSRSDSNEHLFVSERHPHDKLTKAAVEKVLRSISERSGLDKRVTPHILRHTTATQAINAGMPIEYVSKLLGHSSVATTMIYAKTHSSKVQSEHVRCIV